MLSLPLPPPPLLSELGHVRGLKSLEVFLLQGEGREGGREREGMGRKGEREGMGREGREGGRR